MTQKELEEILRTSQFKVKESYKDGGPVTYPDLDFDEYAERVGSFIHHKHQESLKEIRKIHQELNSDVLVGLTGVAIGMWKAINNLAKKEEW